MGITGKSSGAELRSTGQRALEHGRSGLAAVTRTSAWAVALLALLLPSCATTGNSAAAASGPTFIIVRHAEKADDGSKDPPLDPAGLARAQKLAISLQGASLGAVYATAYQRTQATAAPAAAMHDLPVTTYDARLPATELVQRLRRDHNDGTVLVVAHSNTTPAIASALCECTVAPMSEEEYDRHMTIRVDAAGKATLQEDRY